MKLNGKSYSSFDVNRYCETEACTDVSKPKRRKIVLEKIFSSHEKLLGRHHKSNNSNIPTMRECNVSSIKFQRMSSPNKTYRHTGNSPLKNPGYLKNQTYLEILSKEFGKFTEDHLKIPKDEKKNMEHLQRMGFVDERGVINLRFLNRYEQVLRVKHPIKHSITSLYLEKSKLKAKNH